MRFGRSVVHTFSCVLHSSCFRKKYICFVVREIFFVKMCSAHVFVCTPLILRFVCVVGGARCRTLGVSGSHDVPRRFAGGTYNGNPLIERSREALPCPPTPAQDGCRGEGQMSLLLESFSFTLEAFSDWNGGLQSLRCNKVDATKEGYPCDLRFSNR